MNNSSMIHFSKSKRCYKLWQKKNIRSYYYSTNNNHTYSYYNYRYYHNYHNNNNTKKNNNHHPHKNNFASNHISPFNHAQDICKRHLSRFSKYGKEKVCLDEGNLHDVDNLIHEYSQKSQTSVSLQTLTRTGKGEFLSNHDHEQNIDIPSATSSTTSASTSTSTSATPLQKQQHQQRNQRTYSDISSNSHASPEILNQVASFIHHEMPIRLARRIIDLQKVPYLSKMPSVQSVKDIYISSFLTLVNEPNPKDDDGVREALFARKLELLYERHSSVLVQMARGAYELRDLIRKGEMTIDGNIDFDQYDEDKILEFEHLHECHAFLDRFYMSRIGIRVLAGQYLALRSPHMDGYIGLICQHTSPYDIVKHAVTDAYYMCEQRYGAFPKVIIRGRLDLTFAYIPTQLHYILLELLKNAMRATIEHHGVGNSSKWPPVEVIIADGSENEDVVIKVSDEGGGIKRSNMKKIWSYLYTTADSSIQDALILNDDSADHSVDAPIAGLGYGLPISKSYARYFGGDVSINSMEGHGTDAFVHLCRLGDSKEPLPV